MKRIISITIFLAFMIGLGIEPNSSGGFELKIQNNAMAETPSGRGWGYFVEWSINNDAGWVNEDGSYCLMSVSVQYTTKGCKPGLEPCQLYTNYNGHVTGPVNCYEIEWTYDPNVN